MTASDRFLMGPLARRWLFARRPPANPANGAEARQLPRYDLTRAVTVLKVNVGAANGVTINVSRSGTAVRLAPAARRGAGSTDLEAAQEVSLEGLVADPVDCWVVAYGDQILRLRFMATPEADEQIAQLVAQLAANSDPQPEPASAATGARTRGWIVAAGVAVAALAGLGYAVTHMPQDPVRDRLAEAVPDDATAPDRGATRLRPADRVAAVLDASALQPAEPNDGPITAVFRVPAGTRFAATIRSRDGARNGGRVEAAVDADLLDPGNPDRVLLPLGTRLVGRTSSNGSADAVTPVIWTSVVLPDGKPLHFLQVGSTTTAAAPDAATAPLVSLDARTADQVSVQVNRDLALPAYHAPP